MPNKTGSLRVLFVFFLLCVLAASPTAADASHAWGNYHWARTSNPFTLKVGDNVNSTWDSYLKRAISDWSKSSVLNLTKVSGSTSGKNCRPKAGRIEVCNYTYGETGWLGVAQIWADGDHITQGTAKMNDTYFKTAPYNTSAWRRLVMCQEVAHTFGLDHQDVDFSNPNLGTCMDYTFEPAGPPSNEHPNAHDYEELETIYSHLDSTSTFRRTPIVAPAGFTNADVQAQANWGEKIEGSADGHSDLYVRDFGKGLKIFTFVFWAQ